MASAVFPAPAAASSINASSITATASLTQYRDFQNFSTGVYRVTCDSAVVATVDFYLGQDDFLARAVTVSGLGDVVLSTAADNIRFSTTTGTDTIITVTNLATILTNDFTGTLDTITSTGTYTGTSTSGYGYALVIGGGGSGASRSGDSTYTDEVSGGGAGGMAGKIVALTGSMAVTVGTGGTSVNGNSNGVAGTASTFGGMTANGGAAGVQGEFTAAGGTATGGDFNITGGLGGNWSTNSTASTFSPYEFVAYGSIGGGQGSLGGGNNKNSRLGTTLGQGGRSDSNSFKNAVGYGAGGGARTGSNGSGTGAPGVVYVLRF